MEEEKKRRKRVAAPSSRSSATTSSASRSPSSMATPLTKTMADQTARGDDFEKRRRSIAVGPFSDSRPMMPWICMRRPLIASNLTKILLVVAMALRRAAEGKATAQAEAAEWMHKYELERGRNMRFKQKVPIVFYGIQHSLSIPGSLTLIPLVIVLAMGALLKIRRWWCQPCYSYRVWLHCFILFFWNEVAISGVVHLRDSCTRKRYKMNQVKG